ncbi:MAG: hypothetical protein H6736_02115 [Alphaproteobacteria bacterium]|nr:hypothetical protein [Alphaproteobacteria bacterium]MCB9690585.1 hypothetical protein [Alphaproteobacteria bacterium]
MTVLLVLLAGCRQWPDYAGAFDVPTALGVLQPEIGAPFTEPVGVVGSLHGGQIAMLALKQGRFLTDDPTVAFLRGNQLATGQRRLLGGVLPYAHPDGTVTVFAFDRAYQQVIEVPWIVGFDDAGFPIEPATTVSAPVFDDADGSGDSPQLLDLVVKTGWTASETWTATFDGEGWRVEGTRSGAMPTDAMPGEPWVGTNRAVAFTIEGDATRGDSFTFATDANTTEHPAGGVVLEARMAPDQSVATVILQAEGAERSELRFFDPTRPEAFADTPPVVLDAASAPARTAWTPDGADLFVSDAAVPGIWHLHWDDVADRATWTTTHVPLPWPTLDVAPLLTEVGRQVFVAPIDVAQVWSVDLDTGLLKDVDAWREGPQGITFDQPIQGLEAMPIPYLQLETDDEGNRDFGRAVAVSLAGGSVVFADEITGCLVRDPYGPQTNVTGQIVATNDFSRSFESEATYGATLASNGANLRHVLGNACGGITRSQSWTLRYDALHQGWEVTGTLSGRQPTLAREDERYISDDGEISFRIVSGAVPSREGWRITFRMAEGITRADGDENGDIRTLEAALEEPGDPLYFHYEVGPRTGGWYRVDDRPHVLVAAGASDRVGRVDPQEGSVDAAWD